MDGVTQGGGRGRGAFAGGEGQGIRGELTVAGTGRHEFLCCILFFEVSKIGEYFIVGGW